MTDSESNGRPDMEKIEHMDTNQTGGTPLSRQVTVSMSPDQYERLFFQPSQPRGDLSKRLGNPTLLGLIGFLVCYTSTMFILLQWRGAVPPTALIGLSGDYYFLGAIAMNVAGICEFVLGNTFPFCVFVIYGTHWGALAYAQDPSHGLIRGFEEVGGPEGAEWNASQGFHNITMCMTSFVLLLASLRTNVPFVLLFFGLVMLFAFIAAADFLIPSAATLADQEYILKLLKIGGGFGFIGLVCGWYVTIIVACESTGVPCPLPVFDLSGKIPGAKEWRRGGGKKKDGEDGK